MNLRTRVTRWASKLLPAAVLGFFIAGGVMTATATVQNSIFLTRIFQRSWLKSQGRHGVPQVLHSMPTLEMLFWMQVWAHNGVVDTTALDARAKVILPSEGINTLLRVRFGQATLLSSRVMLQ